MLLQAPCHTLSKERQLGKGQGAKAAGQQYPLSLHQLHTYHLHGQECLKGVCQGWHVS